MNVLFQQFLKESLVLIRKPLRFRAFCKVMSRFIKGFIYQNGKSHGTRDRIAAKGRVVSAQLCRDLLLTDDGRHWMTISKGSTNLVKKRDKIEKQLL